MAYTKIIVKKEMTLGSLLGELLAEQGYTLASTEEAPSRQPGMSDALEIVADELCKTYTAHRKLEANER